MSSGYSKTVQCAVTRGSAAFVELPAPPRGKLERLIITQTSGTSTGATINVYDRKGACIAASDLNVDASGTVSGSANTGGFLQITTASDHGLIAGDSVELKNCSVAAYNAVHTVTSVPSSSQLVLSVAHAGAVASSNSAAVLWQTRPLLATRKPVTHLVLTDTVSSGTNKVLFDIDRSYENRDNQNTYTRLRHSALWLEFITTGTATALVFEIAYTCRADTIV